MFRRTIEIIASSFSMAVQELWKNKLRTFLSLFGVTIGIFCIIGVIATINSLQRNIQNEINSLGSNTIYIDKWNYGGGPDYPWWKYVNRPMVKFSEVRQIKERTPSAKHVAFCLQAGSDNVDYRGSSLSGVNIYGVSEEFLSMQSATIGEGRYISDAEFSYGSNTGVIGNDVAEKLFGSTAQALNKEVVLHGNRIRISGVFKKQGKTMISGGWNFDQSLVMPYLFTRTIYNEERKDNVIIVQAKENVSSKVLTSELMGAMRSIRKLSPTTEENFSLNDINDLSKEIENAFQGLNVAGAIIGGISLIVGLFGVANIMFVTVRERTSQIGLKKALGAKRQVILSEFLLESAFLCIIGGLIGLFFVFLLSLVLSGALNFPVYISISNMVWTFSICITVGVIAGIIPAIQAAKMDPVTAIRSK
ncbi:MAG: ABC transporter permease [Niabella sp.]